MKTDPGWGRRAGYLARRAVVASTTRHDTVQCIIETDISRAWTKGNHLVSIGVAGVRGDLKRDHDLNKVPDTRYKKID